MERLTQMINIEKSLYYVLGLLVIGGFWWLRNQWLKPFKYSTLELTPLDKVGARLALFTLTLVLMVSLVALRVTPPWELVLSPASKTAGVIAVVVTFISSSLVILILTTLLVNVREKPLPAYKLLLFNQNFWLTTSLVIATELSFLYWIKEIVSDFQNFFLVFVVCYSGLMTLLGGILNFLSIPYPHWQTLAYRWRIFVLVDPFIIMALTGILANAFVDLLLYIGE
jgi:hypothetical protein